MYVQITTRCNMECIHCGYACTSKGKDMSFETFKRCIQFDEYLEIGGGEPTIHPKFWEFMGHALGHCKSIWLATNGKETQIAIALAKMAKKGIIACDLSQDEYHEYIEPDVIAAFQKERPNYHYSGYPKEDFRGIRNTSNNLINAGRCDFGSEDGCICPSVIVKPNGNVYICGCRKSPKLGNINDIDFELPTDLEYGECYKNQPVLT